MIEHTNYEFNENYNVIIGIDQSLTHSGVVVFNKKELIFATGIFTDTKDSSIEERIFYIRERMREILIEYSPEYASIEGLAYGIASNNGRLLAGVFFSILTLLIEFNIPYKVINPKTLKKVVTGVGSADKLLMRETIDESMLTKLVNFTKLKPTSKKFEDIVDAYWLCVNPIMNKI